MGCADANGANSYSTAHQSASIQVGMMPDTSMIVARSVKSKWEMNKTSKRPDVNGCFVKVIGPGVTKGEWLVQVNDGSGEQMSVSANKLFRLRPSSCSR